jgi:hypothetical protein
MYRAVVIFPMDRGRISVVFILLAFRIVMRHLQTVLYRVLFKVQ